MFRVSLGRRHPYATAAFTLRRDRLCDEVTAPALPQLLLHNDDALASCRLHMFDWIAVLVMIVLLVLTEMSQPFSKVIYHQTDQVTALACTLPTPNPVPRLAAPAILQLASRRPRISVHLRGIKQGQNVLCGAFPGALLGRSLVPFVGLLLGAAAITVACRASVCSCGAKQGHIAELFNSVTWTCCAHAKCSGQL